MQVPVRTCAKSTRDINDDDDRDAILWLCICIQASVCVCVLCEDVVDVETMQTPRRVLNAYGAEYGAECIQI